MDAISGGWIWSRRSKKKKRLQPEELAERADTLLREEIPSKAGSLIGKAGREELRNHLHIASQPKRNPTAASKSLKKSLEELKNIVDNIK